MLAMQYSLGTSGWLGWFSWVKAAARDVHLCLDALREHHITSSWWGQRSLPHPSSLPLPTNCSRDFCRCTGSPGIVRGCLFLCSPPSLNSDSCQASPTPHCWHHCESDPSYQDFSMSSRRRAAMWAVWIGSHSLTASSVSPGFVPILRPTGHWTEWRTEHCWGATQ